MHGLETELAEVKRNLSMLTAAVVVVCNDLNVTQAEGTSSFTTRVTRIIDQVSQLERDALCAGINRSFTIAHSHYGDNIDLEAMSHGYVPGYEDQELEEMETVAARLS